PMLRIATCLVAASLVAGSIIPASAQTTEAKPSRMKLTMQKLKEMKAKWTANRPKLKACKIEGKKKGLTGHEAWVYTWDCMKRSWISFNTERLPPDVRSRSSGLK